MIEALFPWEDLDISPAEGSEVGFPIVYFVDRSLGSRDKRQSAQKKFLSRSAWQVLPRLQLVDHTSPPTDMVYSIRARHPGLAYFGARDDAAWNGNWSSAVHFEDRSFAIEMAIPWKTLEALGLKRNELKVDFLTRGPQNAMPELAWKNFNSISHRLVLEDSVIQEKPYTVRLHFCEPDDVEPGQRVFDVKLQGEVVLKDLDIVRETGGRNTALVKEFSGIPAAKTIKVEFVSKSRRLTDKNAPVVSAIEVQ